MSSVAFLGPQNEPKSFAPDSTGSTYSASQTSWLGLRGPTSKVPTSKGREGERKEGERGQQNDLSPLGARNPREATDFGAFYNIALHFYNAIAMPQMTCLVLLFGVATVHTVQSVAPSVSAPTSLGHLRVRGSSSTSRLIALNTVKSEQRLRTSA